jgi:hypothetical protein
MIIDQIGMWWFIIDDQPLTLIALSSSVRRADIINRVPCVANYQSNQPLMCYGHLANSNNR